MQVLRYKRDNILNGNDIYLVPFSAFSFVIAPEDITYRNTLEYIFTNSPSLKHLIRLIPYGRNKIYTDVQIDVKSYLIYIYDDIMELYSISKDDIYQKHEFVITTNYKELDFIKMAGKSYFILDDFRDIDEYGKDYYLVDIFYIVLI